MVSLFPTISSTNIPSSTTDVPGGCRQLDEAEVEPLTKCRSVLGNVAPWPDQNNIRNRELLQRHELIKKVDYILAGASTFLICVESYFAALKDIVLVRADLSLSGENEAIH